MSLTPTFTRMIMINKKRILSKEEWTALNDLRNDNSIIITRPDKGNGVVIINRLDYLNKMKQLISGDDSKFKSVSMRKPSRTRQEVIQLKSPILLKLGTNVGFGE